MRAIITGANRGIGLELSKLYHQKGYKIWALCRTGSDEIRQIAEQVVEGFDVSNQDSIMQKINELPNESVDILMNNAGVLISDELNSFKPQDLCTQFEINALGPLMVSRALLSRLTEGSKIGLVTSRMGSIEDNTSGGYYGYRASKAALNCIGKSLALDLKPKGISVALLHPGYVKTRMTRFNGEIDPRTSAEGLVQRMEELSLSSSGGFWHTNGEKLFW